MLLPSHPGYSRNSNVRRVLSNSRLSWALVLSVVCILLVLTGGMIQAAHFHASGQADHDCALCVAAHQVVRMAAPLALNVSSRAVARVVIPRTIHHPRRAVFFRLSSRPPPADRLFA